jgi:hypothetical protein
MNPPLKRLQRKSCIQLFFPTHITLESDFAAAFTQRFLTARHFATLSTLGSAAVATVGDMQEAVEAALGVSDEAAVAVEVVGDDKNSRKRYRTKSEEDEAADGRPAKRTIPSHEDQLAARRYKDRQRYASMTRKSCLLHSCVY